MQNFAKSAKRLGKKLDAPESSEPVLRFGLEFYLDAFFDLDTERSHGMGWTRIPWSRIVQYGLYYDLGDEQLDDLIYFIVRMDLTHIARLEEKRAAEKTKGT